MTISLRLSKTDWQLVKAYANYKNTTVSGYIRGLMLKDIENEYQSVLNEFLRVPEEAELKD